MKLLANEAKLTGLWASNCATFEQVLILKFAFSPEKFPGLPTNQQQVSLSYIFARAVFFRS